MSPTVESLESRVMLSRVSLAQELHLPAAAMPVIRARQRASAIPMANPAPTNVQTWTISAPAGQVVGTITLDANGRVSYVVRRAGGLVLDSSPLGVTMAGTTGNFTTGLQFVSHTSRTIDETFTLFAGKSSSSRNRANETTLTFRNTASRTMQVIFRAYDDAFSYRYGFPGSGAAAITAEASGFRPPTGSTGWMQPYVNNYENFYNKGKVGTDFKTGEFGYPALFQLPSGSWTLLTEADVRGTYGATRLTGSGTDGVFRVKLPDTQHSSNLPWTTPWRLAFIAPTLGAIVASTAVENLSPPSAVADTSWIKPGRSSWSWWSNHNSGADFNTQKAYVDFAARMGWEYTLVDEKWNPSWMPQLVQYASTKNVGIIVWTHWLDVDTAAERNAKLPLWKGWGVKGIKVDFMLSDSQSRMKFYDDIIQATLANKLMINFHGGTIPHGQRRTYPHVMTFEAVNGAEQYTYTRAPTPSFNTTLPFTRNAIGPMDYTPVTFSARNRQTTAAHELALSVVYESGWQHFADSIASYEASPAKPFLQAVPANWDETRFITGYPGEFAALARRKDSQWFFGAINAATSRSFDLPLTFLSSGSYVAQIYRDGAAGAIAISQQTVTRASVLKIELSANGGYAIRFAPVQTPPPPTPTGGLTATYFDNADLTGPSIRRTDATINFNWGTGSPAPTIGPDTFSARWTGKLRAPVTGDYILSTTSDDGVRLWLNGQLLINDWNAHPAKENRASIRLQAGVSYDMRIEYFERAGGASMAVAWTVPGSSRQIIPSTALSPA